MFGNKTGINRGVNELGLEVLTGIIGNAPRT
jgi:hypothetical protein